MDTRKYVVIGLTKSGGRVWDGQDFTGDKSKAKLFSMGDAAHLIWFGELFSRTREFRAKGYLDFIIREPKVLGEVESVPGLDHLSLNPDRMKDA